jgi:hypothetical protein
LQTKHPSARLSIAALALSVITVVATTAYAQPPGHPPGRFFDLDKLAVLLDLDPYQKTEVGKILDDQRAARQAERKDARDSGQRPSFADMEARREAARADTLNKLQGVLTDTQIAKFKILTERPARRAGPPPAAQ